MFRTNRLKARLAANEAAYGIINATGSAAVAEMAGLAGYDFVLVDGEHAPGGFDSHLSTLRAIQTTNATALFRIPEMSPIHIRQALDLGFEGILVPDIRDAEAARAAVSASRYPPAGTRGAAPGNIRASDYGISTRTYLSHHGASELFLCVMIESRSAVDDIDAIVAVEGVDAILIGGNDLSASLGALSDFQAPAFLAAVARIEKAVVGSGKALGGVPMPGLGYKALLDRGYRFITNGSDVGFLRDAMLRNIADIRKIDSTGR